MRILTALVVCLLTISGCGGGGGGDSAPEPLSGTLEGKALGVRYTTPTQSGDTDANGTFHYLPGETVTFSIGGVQLGAVPGTANISLFTLAGMTAPASELVLRREIERAQRRQPSPLARAMNLARLLIALDADSNPDNGIDLSGRAAALAGKQIDLGLGLYPFAASLDRLVPNLTRNIPMERTLVFVYQASNLKVASHNPVRYDVNDGAFTQRTSMISYLPNGARSGEESSSVGVVPVPIIGLRPSTRTAYTYDAIGRTTLYSSETMFETEVIDSYRNTTMYDARGNRVSSGYELRGGLSYTTTTTGTANERGLFPETTTTIDGDGDGNIDSRQVTQQHFDANGNPVSNTTELDENNDGVIDSRYVFEDTFDSLGRLDTEIFTSDDNADGVIDLRAVTTVRADGPRAVIRSVATDEDVDGVTDTRSTTRWEYDASGDNTRITQVDEYLQDDLVTGYSEEVTTYDGDHRVLTRGRIQAYEIGGEPYSSTTAAYVYDDRGNLTKVTTDSFGTFTPGASRLITDYEYGPNGERTMFRYGTDYDADGDVDFESTTQITNQQFDDGVLALAQQYFFFLGAVSAVDAVGGVVTTGFVSN